MVCVTGALPLDLSITGMSMRYDEVRLVRALNEMWGICEFPCQFGVWTMQPITSARIALLMSMMLLFNFTLLAFATKPATTGSQSEECSRSSSSKDTCSLSSPIHPMSNLTIGILGTGRLGAHVAATWAAAGHRVLLGSRNPSKAREIVEAIRSPAGYRGNGGEQTKALPDGRRIELEGTDMAGAASAPIIFVATPFPATEALLLSLRPLLTGKIVIDATNPYYSGSGLPVPGRSENSAVELHRNRYKDVMWTKIQPGASGVSFDTCGDQEAKDVVAQLAQSHGFAARDRSHMRSAVLLKCFRCSELLQGRF